jgi:hypothetical protein
MARPLTTTLAAVTLTASLLLTALSGDAAAQEDPAFEDVVYLSCTEVAEQAGDDEAQIVAMVRVLAAFSLEQRGLVVPEGQDDLALRFGELIRAFCTAEPDGLLYNAVHRAMLRLL